MTHKDRSSGRDPLQPSGREEAPHEEVDEETLRRCVAKDERACAKLVRMYEKRVAARVKRVIHAAGGTKEDIEDQTQEVFKKVFTALPGFKHGPRAQFSTWLFKIATNASIDWLRKGGARPRIKLDPEHEQDVQPPAARPAEAAVDDNYRNARQTLAVAEARAKLPDHQREALMMAIDEGLSLKKIAQRQGVPENTVKSRLFRARKSIERDTKQFMEGHKDEHE